MKTVSSLLVSILKRNSYCLLSVLLILILLVRRCQGRVEDHVAVNISIPAIVFCIAIIIMCSCFWVCCCRMLIQRKRHYHRIRPDPTAAQYSTYGPQTPPHYGTGTQHYPAAQRSYTPPSTAPGSTATPSSSRPYSYISPPVQRSQSPPEATTSSQPTVPPVYEPVSLPEATLHHGEPPPDYEEAIKMEPPDTIDQD